MAKSKYWNGTSWEVLGTDASKVTEETNKRFMTDAERTKLAAIEAGATADQTASEILTAIKTVDGAGTGLDADLLDGNHASAFSLSDHTHSTYDRASSVLSGANVFSNIVVEDGIVTSTATRALAKADVGLGNVTNDAQMPIAGGTFTGIAVGQNNTSYTTKQLRNITLSTADPSGGSNGDVWIKYTP